MNVTKTLLLCIISGGLLIGLVSSSSASEILYPPTKSITETGEFDVIILAKKAEVELISVIKVIDRKTSYTIATEKPTSEMKNYMHILLQLEPGINNLEIRIKYLDGKTEKLNLSLFYQPPGTNAEIQDGYSHNTFHGQKISKQCSDCHQTELLPTDKQPVPQSQSTCYSCHKRITDSKYVHGPNATFQCLACHRYKKSGFYLPVRGDTLCFACHIEEEPNFREKYVHGPVNTGNCLICHNIHSSNYPFFLKNKINSVCFTCHPAKSYIDHPVNNHPLSAYPDPNRPGRELSCTSCHNPHSSEFSPFLFYRKSSATSICFECHKK